MSHRRGCSGHDHHRRPLTDGQLSYHKAYQISTPNQIVPRTPEYPFVNSQTRVMNGPPNSSGVPSYTPLSYPSYDPVATNNTGYSQLPQTCQYSNGSILENFNSPPTLTSDAYVPNGVGLNLTGDNQALPTSSAFYSPLFSGVNTLPPTSEGYGLSTVPSNPAPTYEDISLLTRSVAQDPFYYLPDPDEPPTSSNENNSYYY